MILDPNPNPFPAPWADAWGEDRYGLWQAFEIAGVRQVLRWIVPGRFEMGSPEDEPERSDNEGVGPAARTGSRGYLTEPKSVRIADPTLPTGSGAGP